MNIELIKNINAMIKKIIAVAEEEGDLLLDALGTPQEAELVKQLNATLDLMDQYLEFSVQADRFWIANGIDLSESGVNNRLLH
ncbi:MAG: hypothetical protein ACMZ64_07615 [Oleiphilus sp.]